MIGVCTDSNSQLPVELAGQLGIEVVPLTVTIDGVEFREGVDLDADRFWKRFAGDGAPMVGTATPSPEQFLEAWHRLAESGVSEVVSVHIGGEISGTLEAARIAAAEAPVPVRLVDTGSASFVVACAAWAAADAAEAGTTAEAVAEAARSVATSCGNVFVVGTLELALAGGRLAIDAETGEGGIPVLSLIDGKMRVIHRCAEAEQAAAVMSSQILSTGRPLRVGIGASDVSSFGVADMLGELLSGKSDVELVQYRVGPSVGVHTGPGTAGAVFHPLTR